MPVNRTRAVVKILSNLPTTRLGAIEKLLEGQRDPLSMLQSPLLKVRYREREGEAGRPSVQMMDGNCVTFYACRG